jgi:hypothetical protein
MKNRRMNYFKFSNLFFAMIVLILVAGCGPTPTVPIINSFLANPTTITVGESSTLSWSVTDATGVTIDNGIGSVALTGTTAVNPTATTTYTLTATNTAGSVTGSVTVTVGAAYGSIDINSNPDGAKVYLDGVDTGQVTPIILTNIGAGIHTVKLDKFHYKLKEDNNVTVNTGVTTYLNWSLTYASTQTITLQPGSEGKDSDVYEGNPSNNSGGYTALWVGYSTSKWRAYLQFDLSPTPLPTGAVVTNAYLKLYQYNFLGSGSFSVGLYKVTGNWGENSITWNNQPTSSSGAEAFRTIYTSTGTWRTWYIDDLVKGWLDGSISNYGMLLKPADEASNDKAAYFRSSDYTTDNTKRPKLGIDYYIP